MNVLRAQQAVLVHVINGKDGVEVAAKELMPDVCLRLELELLLVGVVLGERGHHESR